MPVLAEWGGQQLKGARCGSVEMWKMNGSGGRGSLGSSGPTCWSSQLRAALQVQGSSRAGEGSAVPPTPDFLSWRRLSVPTTTLLHPLCTGLDGKDLNQTSNGTHKAGQEEG